MPRKKENRLPFSTTVEKCILDEFEKLYDITKIPKTKLTDEAFNLLLDKYRHLLDTNSL